MAIAWSADGREFHLRNDRISYVIRVHPNGTLGHRHFGATLAAGRSVAHGDAPPFGGFANRVGDPVALEYPTTGSGDYRVPALTVELADGSGVLELVYVEHRILRRQARPPGRRRPAGHVRRIGRRSRHARDHPRRCARAASRRARPTRSSATGRSSPGVPASGTTGAAAIRLTGAMSATLDLADARWELVQLSGAWARENHVISEPAPAAVASRSAATAAPRARAQPVHRAAPRRDDRGRRRGLRLQPRLLGQLPRRGRGRPVRHDPGPDRDQPEHVHLDARARRHLRDARGGPRPLDDGLGAMSDALHGLYRERLARGTWRDAPRPVLINNWEATYFDFDEAKLLDIATAARDLGVELFVLDDGWFGERDRTTRRSATGSSTGASCPTGSTASPPRSRRSACGSGSGSSPRWSAGEAGCSRRTRTGRSASPAGRGPRAASSSSSTCPGRRSSTTCSASCPRSSRARPISYVKWDMNRTITEPYSPALPADRQGEFFHRYILGRLRPVRRLTAAFPDILFESCASGGGRFDPGMLAFAPQAWTSDDTDAVERLRIQWGTSLAYPLSSMGAHVAAVPNHQTGRITPIATRAAVAFFGVFGYELDPTALDAEERAAVAEQIAFYKAAARALPARPVRPPAQPVRGRRQPDRLGGRRARCRRARSSASTRRSTGPVPAGRPAAAARARSRRVYRVTRLAGRRRRPAGPRQRRACAAATS